MGVGALNVFRTVIAFRSTLGSCPPPLVSVDVPAASIKKQDRRPTTTTARKDYQRSKPMGDYRYFAITSDLSVISTTSLNPDIDSVVTFLCI
jgi:hypothetical protein